MANAEQILETVERMTEELERVKKYVLTQALGRKRQTKAPWQALAKAAKRVTWDHVTAVEEIRQQRGRGER